MEGLRLLAAADLMERQQAAYAADLIWSLAQAVHAFMGNGDFDVDPPSRFARIIEGREGPADSRTERQIADDVIARLDALELEGVGA